MGLNPIRLESPVFGVLTYANRCWKGQVQFSEFAEPFTLIVRANKKGPTAAQELAFQKFCHVIHTLKEKVGPEMLRFHQHVEAPIHSSQATPQTIWGALVPDSLEVQTEEYYSDGRIALHLLFTSLAYEDFVPAVEIADGDFVGVLMI